MKDFECVSDQHHEGIKKCFEKAAPHYENYAVVQKRTGKLLVKALLEVKTPHKEVLDLGCGDGTTTLESCRAFDEIQTIHVNDFCSMFLEKALSRLRDFNPQGFLYNFDHEWTLESLYDLIFSNMAFQWSLDIDSLFVQSASHLKQGGFLGFTLPLKGTFAELDPHSVNRFHTFCSISESAVKTGFRRLYARQYTIPQKFKTYSDALKSIKGCGAHYIFHENKRQTMMNRTELYRPVSLTYQIGVFVFKKELSL